MFYFVHNFSAVEQPNTGDRAFAHCDVPESVHILFSCSALSFGHRLCSLYWRLYYQLSDAAAGADQKKRHSIDECEKERVEIRKYIPMY